MRLSRHMQWSTAACKNMAHLNGHAEAVVQRPQWHHGGCKQVELVGNRLALQTALTATPLVSQCFGSVRVAESQLASQLWARYALDSQGDARARATRTTFKRKRFGAVPPPRETRAVFPAPRADAVGRLGCRTRARRLCLGAPASAVPKPSTIRTRPSRAFCRAAARVACAGAPHRLDAPADQRHASSRLVWGDGPASGRQWLLSPATTTAQRITAAGGGWSATSLIVGFLSATWSTTGLRRPPLPLRKGPFLLPPRLQLAGADGSAITCLSAADKPCTKRTASWPARSSAASKLYRGLQTSTLKGKSRHPSASGSTPSGIVRVWDAWLNLTVQNPQLGKNGLPTFHVTHKVEE